MLEHVLAETYRPVKPRVIARQMALNGEETIAMKKAVRFLAKEGRLNYGSNHVVFPPLKAAQPAKAGASSSPLAPTAIREVGRGEGPGVRGETPAGHRPSPQPSPRSTGARE